MAPRLTAPQPVDRQALQEFSEEFLVACPCCGACAHVTRPVRVVNRRVPRRSLRRQVECRACGFFESWGGAMLAPDGPVDWFFGLPLWLQAECCGHTLYAYNAAHLRFLEEAVASTFRYWTDRPRFVEPRVPSWMLLDEHRADVLRTIERLASRR